MNGPRFLAAVIILLTLLTQFIGAASAHGTLWQPAERITHNDLEDRTTSGSLTNGSFGLTVVWMQEQVTPGWRLMWSELSGLGAWTPPQPVNPSGSHSDFDPRITGYDERGLVWQRGLGESAEIMFAIRAGNGWTIEPITMNATEDVAPDVALEGDFQGNPHVVWAGFDSKSGSGKIFHATREAGEWQIELLDGSDLGPFWTGAAPRVAVNYSGIVHVVYRGGDFGDYHAHYARKHNGVWTYQVLTSGNANDLIADVAADGFDPVVAMSGNDGFGFPSRIYVRHSGDEGLSFSPPELASGSFSASLNNVTAGPWHGIQVAGSEVSGNIYTGNVVVWGYFFPSAELLPPADEASEAPSIDNAPWIVARGGFQPGYVSCAFTNHGGSGPDSAEVYVISSPIGGAVGDGTQAPAPAVSLRVVPNPTPGGVRITAVSPVEGVAAATALSIYDATGRLVQTLLPSRNEAAGTALFNWDGRSAAGPPVTAGIYFLKLDGNPEARARLTVIH